MIVDFRHFIIGIRAIIDRRGSYWVRFGTVPRPPLVSSDNGIKGY